MQTKKIVTYNEIVKDNHTLQCKMFKKKQCNTDSQNKTITVRVWVTAVIAQYLDYCACSLRQQHLVTSVPTFTITDAQVTYKQLASVTEHRRQLTGMISAEGKSNSVVHLGTVIGNGLKAVSGQDAALWMKLAEAGRTVSHIALHTEPRGSRRWPSSAVTQVTGRIHGHTTIHSASSTVVAGVIVNARCRLRKTHASTTLLHVTRHNIFQSQVLRQGKNFITVDVKQLTTCRAFKAVCQQYNDKNIHVHFITVFIVNNVIKSTNKIINSRHTVSSQAINFVLISVVRLMTC